MGIRRREWLLVSVIAVPVALGIVLLAGHVFRAARRTEAMSTITSITAAIHEMDEATWTALRPTADWRELSPESVDMLLVEFHRNGRPDTGSSRATGTGTLLDPWGNRY